MSTRENITDILCIGCQKGSTSWLHSVLNCHAGVTPFPDSEPVTSTDKEAHFWDRNRARGIEWYRALMTRDDPSLLTMDFTPEYALISDDAIAECKALNPTAAVYYIIRDPLARAVSALRMHMLWEFGEDSAEPLHLDDQFHWLVEEAKLSAHGDYLRNITAWRRQYPDLVVLNYEDFHADSAASIRTVFDRLGLDLDGIPDEHRERFNNLCQGERVWKSTEFPIDRAALMYLHGMTWQVRQEVGEHFGFWFEEGKRVFGV